MTTLPRRNEAIKASELRVIGEDGSSSGLMSRDQALQLAKESGLDLIEVSPNAKPPVAKIVDWGKYNYQRTKQLQKNRKNARTSEIKQIRMGLKIGEHDLDIKLRKALTFLEAGHKVRITLVYRGRELAHKELGYSLANRIMGKMGGEVVADQDPQFAGRQLTFVVRRSSSAKAKNPQSIKQTSVGDQNRQSSS